MLLQLVTGSSGSFTVKSSTPIPISSSAMAPYRNETYKYPKCKKDPCKNTFYFFM